MAQRKLRIAVRALLSLFLLAILQAALASGHKPKVPPSKPIDINVASSDELQELPGIGPVIAQRIIDYRKKSGPFRRVEDLIAVRGISDKRFAKIKPYVTVKPQAQTPAPKQDALFDTPFASRGCQTAVRPPSTASVAP